MDQFVIHSIAEIDFKMVASSRKPEEAPGWLKNSRDSSEEQAMTAQENCWENPGPSVRV
jgi:hypothetical protein